MTDSIYIYIYICECEFKGHAIIARKGEGEPVNEATYSQGWSIGWLGLQQTVYMEG